jgi:CheY-like chemotaxis protein
MTISGRVMLFGDLQQTHAVLGDACRGQHLPCTIEPYPTIVSLRALQHARHTRRIPELIILDLALPRLDGPRILAFLRGDPAFRQVPVIVLSASLLPEDRAACVAADRYFIRPGSADGWINIALFMSGYLTPARPGTAGHASRAAPAAPTNHVLHVEDEADDRAVFARVFARSGIPGTLHQVESVAEALLFLDMRPPYRTAARPTLIVLDLGLPHVDGRELLRTLRGTMRFSQIPIIVLTGSESYRDMEQCRDLLIEDYVTKPKNLQALNEFVASLRRWMAEGSQAATSPARER